MRAGSSMSDPWQTLAVSCHCQLLHMPRCGFQEVSFLGFTSDWWPASVFLQPSHWVQGPGRHGWWGPALSMPAVTASPSPTGILTEGPLHIKEAVIQTNLSTPWPVLDCTYDMAFKLYCATQIPWLQDKLILGRGPADSSPSSPAITAPAPPCLHLKLQQ